MARILIVGKGGREHAIAWRCRVEGHEAIVAPGSDGIALDAERRSVDIRDHDAVVRLARQARVDLVVIGPEDPLVAGLADDLRAAAIPTVGPSAAAARLEGSKADAKDFMARHGIPTGRALTVTDVASGLAALERFADPPVVKADGLAGGKGVVVAETYGEAETAVRACLEGDRFGVAGAKVVLEERLHGQEVSFFALTDGRAAVTFAAARDHKRLLDGDIGPNTGGMGAYAPTLVCDDGVTTRIHDRILIPTLRGLGQEGRPFVGVLFLGLMIDAGGEPWVIEYNCRFGDPEVQPILFGLDDDLVPQLLAAANGRLEPGALRGRPAATVVIASAGYPESSRTGDIIEGLGALDTMPEVKVFHAGTRRSGERWQTDGGRVLGVCARGATLSEAVARAYAAADRIHVPGAQMRRDIGSGVR